jgi:flagellar hook-associated protein 3 FlgL
MNRVSTNMFNNDAQFYLRRRESELSEAQNRVSEQTRIRELRDDPIGAAHATRYRSQIVRLERYAQNVGRLQDRHASAEGFMQSGLEILQRVRELAVTGANGTFSREDLSHMGREVNQLLSELVNLANGRSGDGTTVFSGDRTAALPFEAVIGRVPGGQGGEIVEVVYTGSIHRNRIEISDGQFIESNFPGNQVFWAENQQLYASVDSLAYVVPEDSKIRIDGTEIQLKAGDNIHAVIHRINAADIAVRARLDPVDNSLVLESTRPHQLWLQDVGESRILADLGLIESDAPPPRNIARSARLSGGSAFDMLIHLRDSLYRGDTEEVGGAALRGIDGALENLLGTLGELGAKSERLEITGRRLTIAVPDLQAQELRETGLDLADAITDLRMIEFAHTAALQTAGRVLRTTLLDYLE